MMFHGMGQTPADFSATSSAPQTATDIASAASPQECDPTQQVCEWYCYIPFFPSSDCWTSFESGTKQIATDTGQAVGGTIASAGSGLVAGVASGVTGNATGSATSALSMPMILLLVAAGGIAALVFGKAIAK